MENSKRIRDIMTVFTKIERSTVNPKFKFSPGGSTFTTLGKFIGLMEAEFVSISEERIVDFCVNAAYAYKERENWTIKQVFGPASIKRYKECKRGARYYEDQWLKDAHLTRDTLKAMIADRSEHPQAKFIFMLSEESTKLRHLNEPSGYMVCQLSTLGWTPFSEACVECVNKEKCKMETERKYPELYRLRIEYGKSIE